MLLTLVRSIVRDLYDRKNAARALAIISTVMVFAPATAPAIGGYLHTHFGWQASFVFLAISALYLPDPLVPSWMVARHALPTAGIVGSLSFPAVLLLLPLAVTLLPRQDVLDLFVHSSQVLAGERQERVGLSHTWLSCECTIKIEIEVRTSFCKSYLWTRAMSWGPSRH